MPLYVNGLELKDKEDFVKEVISSIYGIEGAHPQSSTKGQKSLESQEPKSVPEKDLEVLQKEINYAKKMAEYHHEQLQNWDDEYSKLIQERTKHLSRLKERFDKEVQELKEKYRDMGLNI